MLLRDYQQRSVEAVMLNWQSGYNAGCLVCPTGGGKTVIGANLCKNQPNQVLWIAHRTELVAQAKQALLRAGVERSHVTTIQQLMASGDRPEASLMVWDECHHVGAEQWQEVAHHYRDIRHLGLTATPQRPDGLPMGDCYQFLVVAAQYSELIAEGHIVPCRAFKPPGSFSGIGADIALDPVQAYERYAMGRRAFGFAPTKELCAKYSDMLSGAGIPSTCVFDSTPRDIREKVVSMLGSEESDLRVIWSVQTMTEGVDVPLVSCIILAGNTDRLGTFLQKVGRGLRAHPGKSDCVLLDLVGATLQHGSPTEDHVYTLDKRGIQRTSQEQIRQCLMCGACTEAWRGACPVCGAEPPQNPKRKPKIWSLDLEEVFAGPDTPEDAKKSEWLRLLDLCRRREFSYYFAVKEYRKLFGKPDPDLFRLLGYRELERFFGQIRGKTLAQRRVIYKSITGGWPDRSWT